jgi:hypothetical protein
MVYFENAFHWSFFNHDRFKFYYESIKTPPQVLLTALLFSHQKMSCIYQTTLYNSSTQKYDTAHHWLHDPLTTKPLHDSTMTLVNCACDGHSFLISNAITCPSWTSRFPLPVVAEA